MGGGKKSRGDFLVSKAGQGAPHFGTLSASAVSVGLLNEPQHDKCNKMTFAPSKDSDQPAHLPRLIRVFAAHSVDS